MGAAISILLISFLLGPFLIRFLTRLKLGQPLRGKEEVHKLADLHESKKGTPTMGGVMILVNLFLACLMWGDIGNQYLWVALVPTLLLGGLGFIDDYAKIRQKKSDGLNSRQKLIGQMVIGLGVAIYLLQHPETQASATKLQIPFLKEDMFVVETGWYFVVPFFVLIIVGSSNAVNLTDGLDGLAAGCVIPVVGVLAVFAYTSSRTDASEYLLLTYLPGAEELVIFCAALGASALGFLWYNCHPARMFMGDTGSLALGGAIAVVSICVNQELLLVIIGGVFVMEAVSVIMQVGCYKITGKRIFAMSPIHHHFELKGWRETTVVTRFWILGIIFALMGLASLKLR
ncbi:MAG: phospho-N-acetylmuramoyl-pentapeptide-transferase [Verrucomicrobiota bacterium]